jgi:predicted enzyme related to lactoylglutathione lyase
MGQARKHVIVWFEIPAADLARATAFYETILGKKLKYEEMGGEKMSIFASSEHGCVGGCIMEKENLAGAKIGTVVFLNADGILKDAIAKVEKAGGKLLSPVVELPKNLGSWIHIQDTEGNKVGLHAIC